MLRRAPAKKHVFYRHFNGLAFELLQPCAHTENKIGRLYSAVDAIKKPLLLEGRPAQLETVVELYHNLIPEFQILRNLSITVEPRLRLSPDCTDMPKS